MIKRVLLLLFLWTAISNAQVVIPDTIMPFGACGLNSVRSDTIYSNSSLQVMHDSLGFNIFVGVSFNEAEADTFSAAGIYPYPEGVSWDSGLHVEAQQKYSHATYFVTQPEETSRNIRFLTRNGTPDGDYWKWKGDSVMLGDLRFKQYCKNGYLYTPSPWWGLYYLSMQARRDTTTLADSTVVGVFNVFNVFNPSSRDTVFTDSVKAADLPAGVDTYLELYNELYDQEYYKIFEDTCETGSMYRMAFEFRTFDACTLFVDSVLIHCQEGDLLIAGDFDGQIAESIDSSRYENKIAGYFLKDSIRPGSYRPAGYVDAVIRDSTSDWTYPVRGYSWLCTACGDYAIYSTGYRDFVDIAQPEQLWAYLYPTLLNTGYTGYDMSNYDYWQSNLQKLIAQSCDSIREVLADFDSTNAWFFTPQTWFCEPDSGCNGETRRKLTRSEVVCETFIGLCYHPSGIIFYQYDSPDSIGGQGILDFNGNPRPNIYNAIKDDINPYIKAIDATFLSLSWHTAYAVNYENDFDPPNGAWIDTIYAVSNDTTPNPDLGWFHVGQFTEGSDKYVMIVNRACSQGPNNPAPAPPITATIKFDANNLQLGNHVEIIDLAIGTNASDWVGLPDTTFASSLNGVITFSAEFEQGEGRLFKLVSTR